MAQKFLSIVTTFPVIHSDLVSQNMSPTIFILGLVPKSDIPIGIGRYLFLTISYPYMILLSPQYMV